MEALNNSRFSQRLTIGDTAVINNFPQKVLRDYYQTWYDPSLMAVAVSGDVDTEMCEQLIQKWFSTKKSVLKGKVPEYGIENFQDVKVQKVSHESLDKIELNVIQLLDKSPAIKTEKDYQAYLQRILLNKLFKERFSSLSFQNQPYRTAGYSLGNYLNAKAMFGGSVELVPQKINEGIISFAIEAERIFRYGFVEVEIAKIKKRYLSKLQNSVESKSPQKSIFFINEIYSDFYSGNKMVDIEEEYRLAQKYIGQVDSLSLVNLLHSVRNHEQTHYLLTSFDRVANELPNEEQLVAIFDSIRLSAIEPYQKNIDIHESLLAEEPVPGKIISTKRIQEIDADSLVLSNGASVIFKHSDLDKDRINLSGFVQGGLYALDSLDYVSGMYAGSIVAMSGVGDFSREELSHFLAGQNVSMRFLIDKTRSGVIGGASKKDMEKMFRLLYLKWTQPRVDSLVFDQVKQKAKEKYLTKNQTETDKFYKELQILLEGSNYSNREISDEIIDAELKYERLLPVFNSNYSLADNFNFLIIGDCDLDEIKPFIEKYIGGLPLGYRNGDYLFNGGQVLAQNVDFQKNVGDNLRSNVSLIFQSDEINTELSDYKLQSDIMEEIIRTRLLKVLREEMGKIYSVGVSISSTQYPAVLRRSTIRFASKPEDADTLINRTMNELQNLANDPELCEPFLTDIKLNLIKKWKIEMQQNRYWSSSIRNVVFNKEKNWDYIQNYDRLVNGITKESIADAIKNNFLKTPVIKVVLNPKENVANTSKNIEDN
uniref:insulinase family protein n=1 Tax=uncultured Draconibacterium sp. TaxID=1573823 RepID=UPI003216FBC3